MRCLFQDPGGYQVKCFIDDIQGVPQADDDEIHKQMVANVGFEVRVLKVFSTDGSNIQEGSPGGGTIGMEIEWTAGVRPEFMAEHTCDLRSGPQQNHQWRTMSEEITCDFPNKGKYCWNTTPVGRNCMAHLDNGDWTQTARLVFNQHETSASMSIELQNLAVENTSPEYLIYDPDAQSPQNTITYTLKDGWDIYPPGQETTVRVEILNSDGTPVKTEEATKTASRLGSVCAYVWDGRNDAGDLMPKGIYVYRIAGTQNTGEGTVLDPTAHVDTDCEKSWWEIGNTEVEVLDYNEETEMATMRVSFYAGPTAGWPSDLQLGKNPRPKLEVYDPDLALVANTTAAGDLPVHQRIEFPTVQVPLTKGGDYIFLVSPWDSQYLDYCPDKAHRERPLVQHNTKVTIPACVVVIDPGHGGTNVGAHYDWAYENHDQHDSDQNLLQSEELESVFEAHKSYTYVHSNPSQRFIKYRPVYLTRRDNSTVSFARRVDTAARADRVRRRRGINSIVFLSEHNNAAGENNNETLIMLPPGGVWEIRRRGRIVRRVPYEPPDGAQELQAAVLAQVARTPVPDGGPDRDYEERDTEENMTMLLSLWTDARTRHIPGVLVEQVNFQTVTDRDLLRNDDFRTDFAVQTHRGVDDYLVPHCIPGVGPCPPPPPPP